jgi:hypothetical protein
VYDKSVTKTIEATVGVQVSHVSGLQISDPKHVIAWICADGAWFEGRNGFNFEVCPEHADPEECECSGTVAIYRAAIGSAGLAEG